MTVAPFPPAQACDVFVTGICIRDAGALPDIAVDRNTGVLYAVWQDGRISGLGASNVMIAASSDGGFTWTAPIPITESQVYQHFLPTVAVNDNGVIGILFYDFRSDRFTNRSLSPGVFHSGEGGVQDGLGESLLAKIGYWLGRTTTSI